MFFLFFLLFLLDAEFFLCHRPSPLPFPCPQPATSQSAGAPPHAESWDSERTVSEVGAGETGAPINETVMESPTSNVTVALTVVPI